MWQAVHLAASQLLLADPPCPHCGKPALRRLVSTFATVSSAESDDGGDFDQGGGGGAEDDSAAVTTSAAAISAGTTTTRKGSTRAPRWRPDQLVAVCFVVGEDPEQGHSHGQTLEQVDTRLC